MFQGPRRSVLLGASSIGLRVEGLGVRVSGFGLGFSQVRDWVSPILGFKVALVPVNHAPLLLVRCPGLLRLVRGMPAPEKPAESFTENPWSASGNSAESPATEVCGEVRKWQDGSHIT